MSADDEALREATSLASQLSNGLVTLERSPEDTTVAELFRTAHSLKSVCGMAGMDEAATLAHAIEDFLAAVRAGDVAPAGTLVDGALDAVDEIQAILDAVETGEPFEGSPDRTAAELRDRIGAQGETDTGADPPETGATETSDIDLDHPEPDADLSVEEALERASAFDDLDSLAADIDDEDAFPELEGAGSFDEIEWDEASSPAPDGETSPQTDTAGPEPAPGEPSPDADPDADAAADDAFDGVRAETPEETDIDTLEADITAESFGEFDDEDDVSIRELVEMEPDADTDADLDPETNADPETDVGAETDADPKLAAEPDTDPDAETEERETVGVDDGVATTTSDAFEDATTDADTEETADDPFIWVGDLLARETDIDALEADIAAEPFGEFDDEDDVSIRELVEMEPDPDTDSETESVAASTDPAGSADTAEPAATGAADDPTSDAEADGPILWVRDAMPEVADIDTLEADITAESFGEFDDEDDVSIRELVEMNSDPDLDTDSSETAGASPDLDTQASTEPLETADEDTEIQDIEDLEIDFSEAATAAPQTGPEDVPDEDVLDVLADIDLDQPGPRTGADEVEFEREAGIEAFDDRFGELFDVDSDGGDGTPSAGTIEDSTLDADRFRRETSVTTDSTGTSIHSINVDVATSDDLLNLVGELSMARLTFEDSLRNDAVEEAEDALGALQSIEAAFRRSVTELRLMPLSPAVDGLPRVARDIARDQGKRLAVDVEGEDVKLDRSVVERIGEPLVHLVRNAADHGIEPPEEREAAGKPAEGRIELRAERVRDGAVIEVTDDGRGIDPDAVLAKALEDGVVTESEAETMTDEDAYDLLFHHGLTTSEEVTDVSGRGVGMDIVSRICDEVDGSVEVESDPGEGTTVRLRLPVTVAMASLLFVEAGGERYAIPTADIEYVGAYGVDSTVNDGAFVPNPSPKRAQASSDEEDQYRLLRLHRAFDGPVPAADDGVLVWLRPGNGRIALYCDDVVESRDAVVKPYGAPLDDVPGISGATMQENGDVVNIIDVTTIA